ncbi:MAG: sulfatase [Planctomycetota bacterium]
MQLSSAHCRRARPVRAWRATAPPSPRHAGAVLLVALAAVPVWCGSSAGEGGPPPNILFILTEDQGAHLSFVGTAGLETPHMDSIAQQGAYFREAFVNYPVCSASKANIYTGLHSHANGVPSNTINYFQPADTLSDAQKSHKIYQKLRVPDGVPTLVEVLKAAGYRLGVTHKLHITPVEKFPYDEWVRSANGRQLTDFIAEAASASQPWFFFCNIEQPHRPFRNSDNANVELTVDRDAVKVPGFLPDTDAVRTDWAEYLDAVERADRRIGGVLAALRESESAENTLVIFMGDHGPAFHRGKVSPYDFGLRVPLAISGPGVQAGGLIDEVVSAIDLMPTILEFAGLKAPDTRHGSSLMPLLSGSTDRLAGRDYVVGEVHHGTHTGDNGMQERSVYDGRYRLIYREGINKPRDFNADLRYWVTPGPGKAPWHNRSFDSIVANKDKFPLEYRLLDETCTQLREFQPAELELYDVTADPFEVDNLVDAPRAQPARARLLAALVDHISRTGDTAISESRVRRLARAGRSALNVSPSEDDERPRR